MRDLERGCSVWAQPRAVNHHESITDILALPDCGYGPFPGRRTPYGWRPSAMAWRRGLAWRGLGLAWWPLGLGRPILLVYGSTVIFCARPLLLPASLLLSAFNILSATGILPVSVGLSISSRVLWLRRTDV
jgi:hypothetical protein